MKAVFCIILMSLTVTVSAQDPDCVNCLNLPPWLKVFNPNSLPKWPISGFLVEPPLVEIETPALKRNPDSSYCRRKNDVIDTLVFHHTQTLTTTTVQEINNMHLDEGTADDPWLMIGYHYTINSAYEKELLPGLKVSQGRPVDLAGSHAGSDAYRASSPEAKANLQKPGSMLCGKATGPLKEADDKFKNGLVKANYNTIGIAIIGNYALKTTSNPGGYPSSKPRIPSKETLRTAGRLACQLQRENPNIKTIKWHNYYKSTECPGTIKKYISEIIKEAAKEKCIFN